MTSFCSNNWHGMNCYWLTVDAEGCFGGLSADGVVDGARVFSCIISPGLFDEQRSSADSNAAVRGQSSASFTPNHTDLRTRRPAATQRHVPTFQRQRWQRQTHSVHCIWRWADNAKKIFIIKGIVHFEIKIWYLSAYPKGIQDVGVFFSSVDPILMFLGQTVLVCQSYNGRYNSLSL